MNMPTTKWTPEGNDAINLATIRWYAITLERLLIEMYSTNRKRWPDIQKMLETEFGWSGFVTNFGLDGAIAEMQ